MQATLEVGPSMLWPSICLRAMRGAVALLAFGCGVASSQTTKVTRPVASITVTPASAVVLTADTLALTATPRDAQGVVLRRKLVWSSGDTSVARVTPAGLVRAIGAGTATISATVGGLTATSQLTVYVGQGARVASMSSYDSLIPALMAKWEIPGGVVGVVKDGRLVFVRGYGYADTARKTPVAPTALFRLASISKSITAAAILTLVEAGKLSLDAKAFALIPSLHAAPGATIDPRLATITVRELLNHTAGWDRDASFDPMFRPDIAADAVGAPRPASAETVIRYMLGVPLDFEPGAKYAYSNFGYNLLGRIVERLSGTSYAEYVRAHVLAPAGAARIQQGHTQLSERLPGEVHYYDSEMATSVFGGAAMVPEQYGGFYLEAMDSHGGWVGSAPDLLRFILAVDGRPTRPDILNATSIAEMTARPAGIWNGSAYWYGMGWDIRPSGGDANWWHSGSLPGTTTLMVRAFNGLSWVALFNARHSNRTTSFDSELDVTLWKAANAVTAWPTIDRFGAYP